MSTDAIAIPSRLRRRTPIVPHVESMPRRPSEDSAIAPPTDEILIARAQAGSSPAFVELVRRFDTRLFNFLLRRVGHVADAEDLTQEAFLRAWQRIDRFRPARGGRFSTWLFTIASRAAIDHLRAQASRNAACARLHRQSAHEDSSFSNNNNGESRQNNIWTLAAEILADEQHAALWLRYAEDLSNREIARVLGRTTIGVRVLLHRARGVLSGHLARLASEGDDQ
jgi:RNA polymerase sigma-70 factor (ECF subfamily)